MDMLHKETALMLLVHREFGKMIGCCASSSAFMVAQVIFPGAVLLDVWRQRNQWNQTIQLTTQ